MQQIVQRSAGGLVPARHQPAGQRSRRLACRPCVVRAAAKDAKPKPPPQQPDSSEPTILRNTFLALGAAGVASVVWQITNKTAAPPIDPAAASAAAAAAAKAGAVVLPVVGSAMALAAGAAVARGFTWPPKWPGAVAQKPRAAAGLAGRSMDDGDLNKLNSEVAALQAMQQELQQQLSTAQDSKYVRQQLALQEKATSDLQQELRSYQGEREAFAMQIEDAERTAAEALDLAEEARVQQRKAEGALRQQAVVIEQLQVQLAKESKERSFVEAKLVEAERKAAALVVQLETEITERKRQQQIVNALDRELAESRGLADIGHRELLAKADALTAQLRESQYDASQAKAQLEASRSRSALLERSWEAAQKDARVLEDSQRSLKSALAKTQQESSRLTARLDKATALVAELEEARGDSAQLDAQRSRNALLERSWVAAKQEVESLRSQQRVLQAVLSDVRRDSARLEGEAAAAKRILATADGRSLSAAPARTSSKEYSW